MPKSNQLRRLNLLSKREPRTHIVSFRLRASEAANLLEDLRKFPVSGIESLKQFARKLAVDYGLGRLVYVMPLDRAIDFDSRDYLPVEAAPDCRMSNKIFLAALSSFIATPENWHKLRLFMLRAGWPSKLNAEFNRASNNRERLAVAQKFIAEMIS